MFKITERLRAYEKRRRAEEETVNVLLERWHGTMAPLGAERLKANWSSSGASVYLEVEFNDCIIEAEGASEAGLSAAFVRAATRVYTMRADDLGIEIFTGPAEKAWWDVLGVAPGASKYEILGAYRTLLHKHHPDRGGSTELMAEINAARDQALAPRH